MANVATIGIRCTLSAFAAILMFHPHVAQVSGRRLGDPDLGRSQDLNQRQLEETLIEPIAGLRPFEVDMSVFSREEVAAELIPAIVQEERVPRRYIVVMEDGTQDTQLGSVVRALRYTAGRGGPSVSIDRLYSKVAVGFSGELSDDAVDLVRNIRGVSYVEEDVLFSKQQDTLPWGLDRMDQPDLPLDQHFVATGEGSGVDVYVVDTGIRYSHKEFRGGSATTRARWSGYDAFNNNGNDGADCDGHGTHVAGIIGGKKSGVAKGVNLVSVRVLDCQGNGYASDILAGLNWILDKVRSTPNKKAIVGMSLAGQFTQTVNAATKKLVDEGAVVIAAAGNYKKDACRYSPASEPEVITVGGTKNDDTVYDFQGFGSNFGGCVDIFAPGQHIHSASNNCDDCYHVLSGTSQAAPHVVGAAAILLQKNPGYTPVQVRSELLQLASRDKISFDLLPNVAKPLTPNKLLYLPQVSNLASNEPFCRTVWSPLSDWLAGSTTQVSCSTGETMTSCSSLADDNNRAGEYIEIDNGVNVCRAVNGDGGGMGVYAVARCCLWHGMTCHTETSQTSSTEDNARVHAKCDNSQGYTLSGCSAYTTGHIIGGARPASNRISIFATLPFHTCIGQNSPGGVGVRAQANCCRASNLDCKSVWSARSALGRGSTTHATCEEGWHLTGCNSYTWGGNASGAQSFDNKCFARNGMDDEAAYAVAICCRS